MTPIEPRERIEEQISTFLASCRFEANGDQDQYVRILERDLAERLRVNLGLQEENRQLRAIRDGRASGASG